MMIIYSPSDAYTIISRLHGNKRRLAATNAGGEDCLLVIVDHPPLARKIAPFLTSCHETFRDLFEVFPYEEGLCAVFSHRDARRGRPLRTVLSDAPPPERAAVLKSLFARLLAQDIPFPILCDLLRPENLLSSGEIGFVYDLHLTADYLKNDRAKAMACLLGTVGTICGNIKVPSAETLCAKLTGDVYDRTALYSLASDAAQELEVYVQEPEPEQPSLRERLDALRASLAERAAALIALLVLAAGYILMGVLFYQTVFSPQPVDNGIVAIGTVVLENEEET